MEVVIEKKIKRLEEGKTVRCHNPVEVGKLVSIIQEARGLAPILKSNQFAIGSRILKKTKGNIRLEDLINKFTEQKSISGWRLLRPIDTPPQGEVLLILTDPSQSYDTTEDFMGQLLRPRNREK